MKTPKQILQDTYLLLRKNVWIKGAISLDEDNNPVEPTDPNAKQFCLVGALNCAGASSDLKSFLLEKIPRDWIMKHYNKGNYSYDLVDFNDSIYTEKGDILYFLKKTIDLMEE